MKPEVIVYDFCKQCDAVVEQGRFLGRPFCVGCGMAVA